jgi:hypothetical protein
MKNKNQASSFMKKFIAIAICLSALTAAPVFGQSTPPNLPHRFQPPEANAEKPALTKFNLNFPGGTPADLVAAIEKATGKPLNAIIPTEDADIQLPQLKMNDVVTPQLFAALQAASRKTVAVQYENFGTSYSQVNTDYGFTTGDSPVTDTSIWYFRADKPSLPPVVSTEKVCQFYSLEPYLDHGFTVDDITTAIQTGWKMAGINPAPKLNYHKETGLLIAFGEPQQLQTIRDVLGTLPQLKSQYWTQMNDAIVRLQQQVIELQTKVSTMKTNAAPKEKTGK